VTDNDRTYQWLCFKTITSFTWTGQTDRQNDRPMALLLLYGAVHNYNDEP